MINEPADLRVLIEHTERQSDRKLAAFSDREGLAVLDKRDLIPGAVRAALDLRWQPSGALHGRRTDAISTTFRVVADTDGVIDVSLIERWATERRCVPEGVALTREDWTTIAAEVVELARRERERASRTWSVQTQEEAVARRVLVSQACHVDERGDLVGHARADEPTRAQLAEHAAKVAAQSPVNRLMAGAPLSPWPEDRPITAGFLEALAATTTLVQAHEKRPDWANVVQEIRALVQRR
jgi:hypothetical protein